MATLVTLQELSDAWNELRNAALGRGVSPIVSPELADVVGVTYEAFRAWLADQGPLSSMVETTAAHDWLERYNELRAEVAQESPAPEALPETFGEAVAIETEAAVRAIGAGAVAVAALGVAGVVLWAISKGRR